MSKHIDETSGLSLRLLLMLLGLVLIVLGCSREEVAPKKESVQLVKILTITDDASTTVRKFPGTVHAADRIDLSFEVSGKLIALNVKAGQVVKKGDLVARIDPRDFQASLDASQSRARDAKADLDRFANLLKEKVVAKATYDTKLSNWEVASADVRIAEKAVKDTYLYAPFEGLISQKMVENFQNVQAREPVVSLMQKDVVEIIVNAPENVMSRRQESETDKVEVEFANYPGRLFPVTVKEFATEADPQTQTYRVVLSMPYPEDATILAGMTATIYQTLEQRSGTGILVPIQSVFEGEKGGSAVWKVSDGMQVSSQTVQTGTMEGDSIRVTAGLQTGDRIVTSGVQNLKDGMQVRAFTGTFGE